MAADRAGKGQAGGYGAILTLVVGVLVGLLVDECFLRSGYHPVALSIDPKLLKSAVGNDPELEAVLRLDQLREENSEQQKALQQARRQFEFLESKYRNLEQDFHAAINMERPQAADAPRLPLTPDCILAVRAARQRACPCDTSMCPVLYDGDDCREPAEDIPRCLDTWGLPWQHPDGDDFHMWTLNQETISKKNIHTLHLGKYDEAEDVVVQLGKQVMEQLPSKEILNPEVYRSCAVVGSSDNLLRQFLGDEINDHDVVIRFNGATTKGYEKHVGRITNIRFVTNPWIGFRELPQETVIYLDPNSGDPLFGCDRVTECTNATSTVKKFTEELKLFRQLRVTQLHPKIARWLSTPYYDKGKYYKLSSGYQVALLMAHICQEVDIYGFAGIEPRKYFDHEAVQEQFLGAVATWAQEVKDGSPVTYPFADQRFRHRSLLGEQVSTDEAEMSAKASWQRQLLAKKGKKKRAAPAAPSGPTVIQVEEIPSMEWERTCQKEMVLKGMMTVHGIHVASLEAAAQPLAAQQAMQHEIKG